MISRRLAILNYAKKDMQFSRIRNGTPIFNQDETTKSLFLRMFFNENFEETIFLLKGRINFCWGSLTHKAKYMCSFYYYF